MAWLDVSQLRALGGARRRPHGALGVLVALIASLGAACSSIEPSPASAAGAGTGAGAASGAGGSDGGALPVPEPADPPSPECIELATAQCDKMRVCDPIGFIRAFDDDTLCQREQAYRCSFGRPLSAATAADVLTCAAAYPGLACVDFLMGTGPAQCAPVFHGTAPATTACVLDGECASGHCTNFLTACGWCERVASEGEGCQWQDADAYEVECAPGLACVSHGANPPPTCMALVGESVACDPGNLEGQVCRPLLDCVDGKCAPAAAVGAACADGAGCTADEYCEPSSGSCVALPVFAALGEPCGDTSCRGGAACRPSTPGGTDAVCRPPREEGQPCGEDAALGGPSGEEYLPATPCRTPAQCIDGTCMVTYYPCL